MSKRWSACALVSSLAAFAQVASAVPITLAAAPGVANVPGVSDVVVMDDFIFAEPVPEPGTLALLALGLAGLGRMGRARLPG